MTQEYLHLAEVTLFNASGAAIPLSAVNVTSANFLQDSPAARCSDGRADTLCHSAAGIAWLQLSYACAGGRTSVSRVVVLNRADGGLQYRLNAYRMEFLDAGGTADRPPYQFSGGLSNYTITP